MQIVLFFFLENFSLFFFNTRIVKSFHFFLIRFEIKTARVFASGIVSTGNSRAFSAIRSLSLSSILRSHDHRIDDERNKSSLFLGTSLTKIIPISRAPCASLSLSFYLSYAPPHSHPNRHTNTHSRMQIRRNVLQTRTRATSLN